MLAVFTAFGLTGSVLLVLVAIATARIVIVDESLLVIALGLSGLAMLACMIGYLIWGARPAAWWQELLTAAMVGMTLSAAVLLTQMARLVSTAVWNSPDKPPSVRGAMPSVRVIMASFIAAAVLILIDSQTGASGWGWGFGVLVVVIGATHAWLAPLHRYYLQQRLADIHAFEPDLLESLNRGLVSRRVLSAIQRWTEDEGS